MVWGVTGPLFGFSDTWQLVINTGTTIVTFLMVFLIQNTQNRDSEAIQVKLDELIRCTRAHTTRCSISKSSKKTSCVEICREIREDRRARPRALRDRQKRYRTPDVASTKQCTGTAPSGTAYCSAHADGIDVPWYGGHMARYGKKAGQKVKKAMHERKRGKLKSGRSGKT